MHIELMSHHIWAFCVVVAHRDAIIIDITNELSEPDWIGKKVVRKLTKFPYLHPKTLNTIETSVLLKTIFSLHFS